MLPRTSNVKRRLVPEPVGDDFGVVGQIVSLCDRVAQHIVGAHNAAGLVVLGADHRDARGADIIVEVVRRIGAVVVGRHVARLVRHGGQIAGGVVGVADGVAGGVGDLGDAALGVAVELDGDARGTGDAVGGVGEDVLVAVGDVQQAGELVVAVGQAVFGGQRYSLGLYGRLTR